MQYVVRNKARNKHLGPVLLIRPQHNKEEAPVQTILDPSEMQLISGSLDDVYAVVLHKGSDGLHPVEEFSEIDIYERR